MAVLIDTSILGRLANQADAGHETAKRAVAELHRKGDQLHITPQNLIEFRSFATRPKAVNGLGLTSSEASKLASTFQSSFRLLEETPVIYPAWLAMVDGAGIVGKQVHDARLAAVCHAHGVSHLLTFNVQHFQRFAAIPPGLVVLDASKG